MFSKYLKKLTGGTPVAPDATTATTSEIEPVERPLETILPIGYVDAELNELSETHQIDTQEESVSSVVSSVMEINTDGQKNTIHDLRQRILGRFPVLDRSQNIFGYELVLRNKTLRQPKKSDH